MAYREVTMIEVKEVHRSCSMLTPALVANSGPPIPQLAHAATIAAHSAAVRFLAMPTSRSRIPHGHQRAVGRTVAPQLLDAHSRARRELENAGSCSGYDSAVTADAVKALVATATRIVVPDLMPPPVDLVVYDALLAEVGT